MIEIGNKIILTKDVFPEIFIKSIYVSILPQMKPRQKINNKEETSEK